VEGWLIHCLHRVLHLREKVIRATHDQVRFIIRSRYHLELDNQQFARLKARYVTRPSRPATRFELLRELRKGRKTSHGSVPSEYQLTGLRWLFSREGILAQQGEDQEQVDGADGEDTLQDG
jgi:hypothetical protein